ncbi:MAG: hypothetical protein QOJ39_1782 [Candidatus Eremiobacteraeota bacterium]|nr:hypothetical protein [Candidatus Eremiobacteraeota bacterium]
MNAGTPPLRDSLVGMWTLQAGGMQSEVTLQPDGNYSNTLAGGAQGHWGTWAVTDNPFGKMVVFTLAGAFPQEYVGPLGSTPIIWPKTESWQVTGVQPDRIDINGGALYRVGSHAVPPQYPGAFNTADPNAQLAAEMQQVADAGRKAVHAAEETAHKAIDKLKQAWLNRKKS